MFTLPRPLDPQVALTAEALSPQSGRAYTTHSSVGYLPRDMASLCIRHKQLIRLDFHQLDCGLVGCSNVLEFVDFLHGTEFRASSIKNLAYCYVGLAQPLDKRKLRNFMLFTNYLGKTRDQNIKDVCSELSGI
jgi:hypothetical protein